MRWTVGQRPSRDGCCPQGQGKMDYKSVHCRLQCRCPRNALEGTPATPQQTAARTCLTTGQRSPAQHPRSRKPCCLHPRVPFYKRVGRGGTMTLGSHSSRSQISSKRPSLNITRLSKLLNQTGSTAQSSTCFIAVTLQGGAPE